MGNFPGGGLGRLLEIFRRVHGGSLHLLGLTLDLVTCVTGDVTIGSFQLAFGLFRRGISFVGHDDDCNGEETSLLSQGLAQKIGLTSTLAALIRPDSGTGPVTTPQWPVTTQALVPDGLVACVTNCLNVLHPASSGDIKGCGC